jgi:hypothetical protein
MILMKVMILVILTKIIVISILECECRHSKRMILLLMVSTRILLITFELPVITTADSSGRFTHRMPSPCHAAEGLECVFPIWFTRCGHVWFALAMPCSNHAVLLKATAQHVRRETACRLPARVQLLPATARISTKVVIRSVPIPDTGGQCATKERMSWKRKRAVAAHYKKDNLLNCWTSSSDVSGYHAVSHEGHSTIRAWQGDGTARVKLTAWHGHGMLCVNRSLETR